MKKTLMAAAALVALPFAASFAADKGSGNFLHPAPLVAAYLSCADKSLAIADTKVLPLADTSNLVVTGEKKHVLTTIPDAVGVFAIEKAPKHGLGGDNLALDNGSAHIAGGLAKKDGVMLSTEDGTAINGLQLAAAWDAALAGLDNLGSRTQ